MSDTSLAATLRTSFMEQLELYTQALASARQVEAALERNDAVQHPLQDIVNLLNEVAAINERHASLKIAWMSLPPSQRDNSLEDVLAAITNSIGEIQQIVGRVQESCATRQSKLLPDFDALIRRRQMHKAYQSSFRQR